MTIAGAFALSAASAHAQQQRDPEVEAALKAMDNTSTWGHPDQFGQFTGMRYHAKGDYPNALKYFRIGARYADKLSQLSIGLMYMNGEGVERNPATACAWLTLAAERNYPRFVATREQVCSKLDDSQRKEAAATATALTAEFGDAVAKKRMINELNYARGQMAGSRTGFNYGVQHLETGDAGSASGNCAAPTIQGGPATGCANDIYAEWRWKPDLYFKVLDAQWTGSVRVGDLEHVPNSKAPSTPTATDQPHDDHPR